VIADGQIVGRIALSLCETIGGGWTIDLAFHEGHDPAHGFEDTREAATQAFARSWPREVLKHAEHMVARHY
jgi:hypothetical protein